MKATVEVLYHFECDYCGGEWTTYNRCPGEVAICPHCEAINIVEGLLTIMGTEILGVGLIGKPRRQQPASFDVSELD